MREYSLKIAETVKQFLDTDEWNYDFDEENGVFHSGVKLKCKFQHAEIMIRTYNDAFTVLFVLPVKADAETRAKVTEFLMRANYGMIRGGFEMDLHDGEVRFRTAHYCGSDVDLVSCDAVRENIALNYQIVNRYGSELMAVMMGFMEPEEAIEKAEA